MDLLSMLGTLEVSDNGKSIKDLKDVPIIYRNRSKVKVPYKKISFDDFVSIIENKKKELDNKNIELVLLLKSVLYDLYLDTLNNKIGYIISAVGLKVYIDYYEERKARNPHENESVSIEPKVQLRFKSTRYTLEKVNKLIAKLQKRI